MSQSRAPAPGKAAAKAKAKSGGGKRKEEAVTVRVIPAPQPVALPTVSLSSQEQAISERAIALAAEIEQAFKGESASTTAVLAPEAVQKLLAALCKVYSNHVEQGERYDAFSPANPVTPTDVMVTASGLLKAANLAVFELGMWQSWTGR